MDYMFTPGCALLMYKPHLADRAEQYLKTHGYIIERSEICCHHNQRRKAETTAIVACSGCARRLKKEHQGIDAISLWEVMAEDETLQLPDYGGMKMSLHDACPTKSDEAVTFAIRKLLQRMNITLAEAELNRKNAPCCGDSFYPGLREAAIIEKMRERAEQMPCDDVVVHCISCVKSMTNGGKKPRYLLDLVFGEQTEPGELSPSIWHKEMQIFISKH